MDGDSSSDLSTEIIYQVGEPPKDSTKSGMSALVSSHLALMCAYNVVLKCTAFPPYSWHSIGRPPAGGTLKKALYSWLKGTRPLPQFVRTRGLGLTPYCCFSGYCWL